MEIKASRHLLRIMDPWPPKGISYSDVKKMTKSFKDQLGQGGHGNVYKGELVDGGLVAVKVVGTQFYWSSTSS